ncbi:MAG: hypothetical protein ACOYD4_07460 [Solirubrobacterales bacterium]
MTRLSVAIAALGLLVFATTARADTPFGGDPSQAITPGLTCSYGAPTEIGPYFGTAGSTSCMWGWSNPAVGTDIAPIPVTGGSGTVTSVTLPAMPNPGPMQVVVLTAALNAGSTPSKPDYICCQVKQVGPTFTVPANQVATVPQALHVSATEEANLSQPGDTSFGDLLGISVLSPTASLPVRYTGNTSVANFDGVYAYYPAPAGANGEYRRPYNVVGFQMLARFTLALDGPAPTPGPAAAGGLKLTKAPLRVGADGRTVTLGKATNPPTATTTQTLVAPAAARASAAKKPVVYGSGKTTVAAGKTVPLKLKLNGKARAKLKKNHKLRATLTVVAANAQGETQTTTRSVTIKPAAKHKKRR